MKRAQLQLLRQVFARRSDVLEDRAARHLGDDSDREPADLVDEAFVRLVETGSFEDLVVAWVDDEMGRIAREDSLARQQRENAMHSDLLPDADMRVVDVMLHMLASGDRDVSRIVELKYRQGLSDKDVADELGLTRDHVRLSLHREAPMLHADST